MGDHSTLPGGGRRQTATRAATLIATIVALLAFAAPAMAATQFDDFAAAGTFNATDGAGNEIPYRSAAVLSRGVQFNTVGFTLEAPEGSTSASNRTGCGLTPPPNPTFAFGGKSAWVRFVSAADGQAHFQVNGTAPDQLLLRVEQTPDASKTWTPWGSPLVRTLDCIDAQTSTAVLDVAVTAGRPVYLQVLSRCSEGPTPPDPATCQTNAIGGADDATLTFTPKNADHDALPDTLDRCPNQFGTFADGCADSDGDGFDDGVDKCVAIRGVAPAGCPLPDTDGDGFLDVNDDCATIPGVAPRGCPLADTDADGIPDVSDRCQLAAGPSSLSGCPDGDKDGVADVDDACKAQPGGRATGGCPDKDGDLVPDGNDRCRTVKGTAFTHGCPPLLPATVKYHFADTATGVRFTSMRATAPKGTRLEIRCHGRGCFKARVIRKTTRATTQLHRMVGRRGLRAGSTVEVRAVKAGSYGKMFRFRIGVHKVRDSAACLPVGGLKRCV